MLKEKDILYEIGDFWVKDAGNAYEVYKVGVTHSVRCAIIGKSLSLQRAIDEANRREGAVTS